jgi:hypothetical protein
MASQDGRIRSVVGAGDNYPGNCHSERDGFRGKKGYPQDQPWLTEKQHDRHVIHQVFPVPCPNFRKLFLGHKSINSLGNSVHAARKSAAEGLGQHDLGAAGEMNPSW